LKFELNAETGQINADFERRDLAKVSSGLLTSGNPDTYNLFFVKTDLCYRAIDKALKTFSKNL